MAEDKRILVVDDDQAVISIILASLKTGGRKFITAGDGVAAVEKLMSEPPDLVILDVMMPKMNGYQVCRLMKNDRNTWDIPVIMLTARDGDADRMYGRSVGADEYVCKPFHPADLRAAVERQLARTPARPRTCPVEPAAGISEASLLSRVNSLLDRKLQEMTFLQEMTRAVVGTFDEERILELVLEGISDYLGYERAAVFMTEESGLMSEKMSRGYPGHGRLFVFDVGEAELLHELIHRREPVVMDGGWHGERFVAGGHGEVEGHHALIPICSREDVRGVLLVDRSGGGAPFSQERLGVLNTMAGQLGLALDNAKLYRKTLMMSITDGLTGLYNARYFYDRLELEISRARRYDRPLSLLMLDIDNFKCFNDRYGHLAGDTALRRLAKILKANTRETDTAARYGGEEFCIILPETDKGHAGVLAERIRKEVEEATPDADAGLPPELLTVSVGYAALEDAVVKPEDFVRRADKALYKAKQEGRNRVCFFDPGELI